MRDKKMPDHRLECFGMRRHGFRIDRGTTTTHRYLGGVAAVALQARYSSRRLARILQSFDKIGLDVFLHITAPTENTNTHRVQ